MLYDDALAFGQDVLTGNLGPSPSAPFPTTQPYVDCVLDEDMLDDAALRLSLTVADISDVTDEWAFDELEEELISALRIRDEAEIIIAGIERSTGTRVQLPDEVQASLDAFDDLIRERLDDLRLLLPSDRAAARKAWALPQYWNRFWWYDAVQN